MAPAHFTHGIIAGVTIAPLVPHPIGLVPSTAVCMVLCGIGALVPDLDHPKGRLTNSLGPVTRVLSWVVLRMAKAVYMATKTKLDPQTTNGHRGFTHTPVFAALVAVGAWGALEATSARPFAVLAGAALGAGCIAHLCGDSLTNSGVPWFAPFYRNPHTGRRWQHYGIPKRLRFETGGGQHPRALTWAAKGEHVVTFASMLFLPGLMAYYAWMGWGI